MQLSSVFLTPEFILVVAATILLVWEACAKISSRFVSRVALLVLGGALIYVFGLQSEKVVLWEGLYLWDIQAKFFKSFFLICAILVVWAIRVFEPKILAGRSEFYIITLYATTGMILLSSVQDLILLFVSLELVTVSFYILVAYHRHLSTSLEAGVKYLIMGALSSAFLIMGSAYLFGMSGSTHFESINQALRAQELQPAMIFGLVLVLVGLLFKVSIVPFHIWAPDVYQGAPLPITAFLSVGSKVAGFVLVFRLLTGPFSGENVVEYWVPALMILAGASMVLGNFAALPQRNLKRILAYSGIGHAGFILAGLASNSLQGHAALLVYMSAYLVSAMTVFIAMAALGHSQNAAHVSDYKGLSQRAPLLAAAMAVGLVSLAGIPPLIGFMGKFSIFMALWQAEHYFVFGVGVVAAVTGLYYYLNIVRVMYWSNPTEESVVEVPDGTKLLLGLMTFGLILIGFWSEPLFHIVKRVLG